MSENRRKAPWPDFTGRPLYEGDSIIHPSGEAGTILFLSEYTDPADQWRVDYGNMPYSRLCVQIGNKGMASRK